MESANTSEVQLIKSQKDKLEFNLKFRKAKQLVIGSYLYLSSRW